MSKEAAWSVWLRRTCYSLAIGITASGIAYRLGVPVWTPSVPGDAADIGLSVTVLTWYLLRFLSGDKHNGTKT